MIGIHTQNPNIRYIKKINQLVLKFNEVHLLCLSIFKTQNILLMLYIGWNWRKTQVKLEWNKSRMVYHENDLEVSCARCDLESVFGAIVQNITSLCPMW